MLLVSNDRIFLVWYIRRGLLTVMWTIIRNLRTPALSSNVCPGDLSDGERENRHLSDDQAICIGNANQHESTDHLPPAHWLARRVAHRLYVLRKKRGAGQVGPDGKVLITVGTDGRTWKPLRTSISLNHH